MLRGLGLESLACLHGDKIYMKKGCLDGIGMGMEI
jgi:hypothetical protein